MTAFFPVPAWLVRRSDVSWPGKVLFAVLVRYTRKGTREAFPAIETVCSDMASPRRSVERWLAELEHAGLVERERTGRACTFRLAADPGPMSATDGASEDAGRSAEDGASRSATVGASDPPSRALRSATVGASDPPLLAHQASRSPSSGGVEISVDRERALSPALGRRDRIATAWRVGYVRRFERHHATTHAGPAGGELVKLIDAALEQPDPLAFVDRALDGFFGTPRFVTMRPPHAPRFLAENPAGHAAAATSPSGVTDARNAELVAGIPRLEVP